ncbi:ectonucleotide pyrophosphatase/phosphodiesterase [Phenylobacterium terrae]|uniref:Ectonucleotide pyrophosphatase/phosphodiesterase n=1 Tax=Phenylobacterium terrae TaxID=2665495 RepID=A0ABW4N3L0_9CAUL
MANPLARLLALTLALLLSACATTPAREPRAPVILISIDGFRPDYLERGATPTLQRLAGEGASAVMRPSFPSNTFPNHYTLVTGLRPDQHGIVDNTMTDPQIPGVRFAMSNKAAVTDARWWDGGVPIWVSAERGGVRSGTMFWPGSEAAIRGVRPSYWRPFDQKVSANDRVDQVLAWLDEPADRWPRFLTLYFDEVDTAGHMVGPDSPLMAKSLASTDAAIARLLEGLKGRGVDANLVIVADHGMAPISPQRVVWLEDVLPAGAAEAVTTGSSAGLVPTPGREAEAERALLAAHPNMTCWRKGEIPAALAYGRHRRVPPIFCLARTGWLIMSRSRAGAIGSGAHGYDPADPLMAALFIAHGPDIRPGRLESFDNVEVYGLVMDLLGLTPEPGTAPAAVALRAAAGD